MAITIITIITAKICTLTKGKQTEQVDERHIKMSPRSIILQNSVSNTFRRNLEAQCLLSLPHFRYLHLALKRHHSIEYVACSLFRNAYDGLKMKALLVNACETYVAKD